MQHAGPDQASQEERDKPSALKAAGPGRPQVCVAVSAERGLGGPAHACVCFTFHTWKCLACHAPWDLGHCWAQGPWLWPLRGDRYLSEPHEPSPGGFRVSPEGRLGWRWWVPQTQALCASQAFSERPVCAWAVLRPSCAERRLLAAVAGLRGESSALSLVSEHVPMGTEGRLGLVSPWPWTLTVRVGSRPWLSDCGRLTAWSQGCREGLC